MNNERKIIFYPKEPEYVQSDKLFCFDYASTADALCNFENEIHTTQMCFLSTTMFILGYRIFINNQNDGLNYEIPIDNFNRTEYQLYDLLDLYRIGELI